MKNPVRILALAATLAATLSACSSGTKEGDTNVERGYSKKGPAADKDGTAGGDSVTAGLMADTVHGPTGQQLLEKSADAQDRNRDGLAD